MGVFRFDWPELEHKDKALRGMESVLRQPHCNIWSHGASWFSVPANNESLAHLLRDNTKNGGHPQKIFQVIRRTEWFWSAAKYSNSLSIADSLSFAQSLTDADSQAQYSLEDINLEYTTFKESKESASWKTKQSVI